MAHLRAVLKGKRVMSLTQSFSYSWPLCCYENTFWTYKRLLY